MQGDMHPEDIKAEIRKRGGTLAMLARSAGVSTQALSAALTARTSERLERHIASFLSLTAQQIWPSRYDDFGHRMRFTVHATEREAA